MEKNFWIRDWLVEPDRLKITREGREVTLKPRSMAVLVELADADGEVIRRGDLLDRVWKGADVTDDALTQTVVELRRALGDEARHPRYIETVKRVGIRLIPRPGTQRPAAVARRALPWALMLVAVIATGLLVSSFRRDPPVPSSDASIAVLPFANMSADASRDYFAEGLTEEIISVLASVPELRVSARTSSFAYRNRDMDVRVIGERLNVANVLEGSIRLDGEDVRVTAQLIEVRTGFHRWSRSYDRTLDDVVSLQKDIAAEVLHAIAPQFGVDPTLPTTDGRAYDLFLAGRQHLNAGRSGIAARLFADAIAEDPAFALAQANLAIATTTFHENATRIQYTDAAAAPPLEVARTALAAASAAGLRHPDMYIATASVAAYEGDLEAEGHALEQALALTPRSVAARMRFSSNLAARGLFRQALDELDEIRPVDPLNVELAGRHAALIALFSGYDAGIERLRQLVDVDLATPSLWAAMTELAAEYGRFPERIDFALHWLRSARGDPRAMSELGDAYTEIGEFELADRWIAAAERVSTTAALKSRARCFGATGNWPAFTELTHEAAATHGTLLDAVRPTPVTGAVTGLLGLERAVAGDHEGAAQLFAAILDASPSLARRSPYLRIFVLVLLAREHAALGNTVELEATLDEARALGNELRKAGIQQHPWITAMQASASALAGDDAIASTLFDHAIEQGWRSWYIEQVGAAKPLADYDAQVRRLTHLLSMQRSAAERAGLLLRPEDL